MRTVFAVMMSAGALTVAAPGAAQRLPDPVRPVTIRLESRLPTHLIGHPGNSGAAAPGAAVTSAVESSVLGYAASVLSAVLAAVVDDCDYEFCAIAAVLESAEPDGAGRHGRDGALGTLAVALGAVLEARLAAAQKANGLPGLTVHDPARSSEPWGVWF